LSASPYASDNPTWRVREVVSAAALALGII
jgi:hypothetical protein